MSLIISNSGDMLIWSLKSRAECEKIESREMLSHTRLVYNMVPVSASGHMVVSFSLDRSVSFADLNLVCFYHFTTLNKQFCSLILGLKSKMVSLIKEGPKCY